ncbi:MAG: DNA double-strand break repair nuclease NurA [Synechococcaceae cyanobacterium SM2_3_2]|nr:DNA double-strand break repair nuclease NurA [Synechococcaceae cyanobacterium SM2_3_2]
MSLRTTQIRQILDQKREAFAGFDFALTRKRQQYEQAFTALQHRSSLELAEQLASIPQPGALPTQEWDRYQTWCIPFPHQWSNHQDSLDWVDQVLQDVPTFAVDGSQLILDKDISLPVALVQIGWYENLHCKEGKYTKDIRVDVLTPQDLGVSSNADPKTLAVNLRRFEMEVERLIEYINDAPDPHRLAFLDGSLVATFAEVFEPEIQARYVTCILNLLRASESKGIPLVAYIDTTYTRDLTQMVRHLSQLPEAPQIHDAALLEDWLPDWGDRTPFLSCARSGTQQGQHGILTQYQEMRERIGFVYLKTHSDHPVRLEIPIWMLETGVLDWALDIVRCEVIVGKGYPYAIETADQTAVLRTEDRGQFVRLLQDWCELEKLPLRLSRKVVSKLQRRRVR